MMSRKEVSSGSRTKPWWKTKLISRTGSGAANRLTIGLDATRMKGEDADSVQHNLVDAIDRGNFPRWTMFIQTMTGEQARDFRWNPFDLTKVWPQGEFPLHEVGVMELNAVPENYHAHVEQAAFAPAHVVDGIGYYVRQDAARLHPELPRRAPLPPGRQLRAPARKRLPVRLQQLPADGRTALGDKGGPGPNYFPNSFNGPVEDKTQGDPAQELDGFAARYDWNEGPGNDDHYTQAGNLFRLLDAPARRNLVSNVVGVMSGIDGPKKDLITQRQLCHWFRANVRLGMAIAKGLGVDAETPMEHATV